MATLFWEPSTRTRMSFEAAMMHQGGRILGGFTAEGSSVKKGESIPDTIRTICNYDVSVIVMRHKNEGAATLAAEYADEYNVSIINGGDGSHEHPTQTLLDLYTMYRQFGDLKGKKVAIVGDLKYGRTPHSLTYGLGIFGAEIYLVSPEQLKMPQRYVDDFEKEFDIKIHQLENLEDIIDIADVIYMTRVQKERFESPEEYNKVKDSYRMSVEMAGRMKEDSIIMHPLPRVKEIDLDVDKIKHAKYFEQVRNGWIARAALLQDLLEVEI
jgi:aspartate carbamoyltransferase catalytic subunit